VDCVYINLAARPDRRAAIERSFEACKAPGWSLTRFEAVDVSQVEAWSVPGQARPSEKACFLSHRELIRASVGTGRPVMVLEDDAAFGARSCAVIDRALGGAVEASWDLLFTDVCAPNVGVWPDLIKLRRQFDRTGETRFVSLNQFNFAGATAYLLNERSKAALLTLLDAVERIDVAVDIHLRRWTHRGALRAFMLFPFPTTLADEAEVSSVQQLSNASPEAVWNLFRRMVWLERDLAAQASAVEALGRALGDPETRLFGTLFEAMASDRLAVK